MSVAVDQHDEWTCECGNTSSAEGFHPCDKDGNLREPDAGWYFTYRCDRCGAVILDAAHTGDVPLIVGRFKF